MAKPEWGVKRTCLSCGVRYYDMRRDPILCPKCGVEFLPEAALRPRRTARPIVEKVVVAEKIAAKLSTEVEREAEAETPEDEIEKIVDDNLLSEVDEAAEDDEDSVIEDTSDLGEDDDDMPGVPSKMNDEESRD